MKPLPSLHNYLMASCQLFGVTPNEIRSGRKIGQIANARRAFYAAAYCSGVYSMPVIAMHRGCKSHSGVHEAYRHLGRCPIHRLNTALVSRKAHDLAASARRD